MKTSILVEVVFYKTYRTNDYIYITISHTWRNDHSTNINTCKVWEAKVKVHIS